MAVAIDIRRPQYFERQYLGAADLQAEQAYHRDARRRHNLGPHTWGIVAGLELTESELSSSEVEVWVEPGVAIDGFGRPIVLLERFKLPTDKFAGEQTSAADELLQVWLRYHEEGTQPPGDGFELCDGGATSAYTRVVEGFDYEEGDRTDAQQRANIHVAGESVDAVTIAPDGSVPYQQLPEDGDDPLWLVQIGWVRWKPRGGGHPGGQFVATTLAERTADRHYSGLVTAELLAPAGRLRVRDRSDAPPSTDTDDLVAVEGTLRVDGVLTGEGGLRLNGDGLHLASDAGDAKPVDVQRDDGPALELKIPKGGDATKNRLAVLFDSDEQLTVNKDGDTNVAGKLDANGALRAHSTAEFDGKATAKGELSLEDKLTLGAATEVFGDARLKGNLSVDKNITLGSTTEIHGDAQLKGGLSVTGDAVIGAGGDRTIRTRHVTGKGSGNDGDDALYLNWHNNLDVHVGNTGGALYVADKLYVGQRQAEVLPCDVITGEIWLSKKGISNGTYTLTLTSRLPRVTTAQIAVALADISNVSVATDAKWRVQSTQLPHRVDDNTFDFYVTWQVGDIDGWLNWFSYVAYFV